MVIPVLIFVYTPLGALRPLRVAPQPLSVRWHVNVRRLLEQPRFSVLYYLLGDDDDVQYVHIFHIPTNANASIIQKRDLNLNGFYWQVAISISTTCVCSI